MISVWPKHFQPEDGMTCNETCMTCNKIEQLIGDGNNDDLGIRENCEISRTWNNDNMGNCVKDE